MTVQSSRSRDSFRQPSDIAAGAPEWSPDAYVNASGYRFVDLDSDTLPGLRLAVLNECSRLGIRGSVLLSTEGINVMLCGSESAIADVQGWLYSHRAFVGLRLKYSRSSRVTYNRMLVKIKKEIIPVGDSSVRPTNTTGRYISPEDLRLWLDEDRDFVLLDTRNDFEVDLGTFRGATDLRLESFRSISSRLNRLQSEDRRRPVVAFCTGGIRCEKATPLVMRMGFDNVYQLEGGILNYFERCGDRHFEGECFVFDKRVSVNAELRETGTTQCYACQNVLTEADQESPDYVYEVSCPYCAGDRSVDR